MDEVIEQTEEHNMNPLDTASYEFLLGFLNQTMILNNETDLMKDPDMNLTNY